MIEWSELSDRYRVVGPTFDSQRPLANRREHRVRCKSARDSTSEPQPHESCRCQDDRVVLPVIEFAQASFDIAPNIENLEIGAGMQKLSPAADAPGADARALRQEFQALGDRRHQDVGSLFALGDGSQFEPWDGSRGQVLQAVDRQVGCVLTSPCVVIGTSSTAVPRAASCSATQLACQRASGLARVPRRSLPCTGAREWAECGSDGTVISREYRGAGVSASRRTNYFKSDCPVPRATAAT